MNVIIIEDEIRTAKELKSIIEAFDNDITVLTILTSISQSIKWLNENPLPDLIFSDIQLGDGLSFEIFKEVRIQVPIIFCTAFDEYAIQAFNSNSIDYLLKPIEENMVERSLEKYQGIKDHYTANYVANLNQVIVQLDGQNYKQSLLVHYREKMIPIKVSLIVFIYIGNGLVNIYTTNNENFIVNYTIDQLETVLNPTMFFRPNRQFIINRNGINNIEHYFNRRLILQLSHKTPVELIVSRQKIQDFLHWIEN